MSDMINKTSWKTFKALAAGMALIVGSIGVIASAPSAVAQSDTLGASVAREITKAVEIIQATADPTDADFRAALAILDQLIRDRRDRMSPYEIATTYEVIGSYRSQLTPPDYVGALRAFESAIAQNALPENRARQIRYFIAQLYFTQERYPEAIRFLREYIEFQNQTGASINANTWYLLAAAYVATDNYGSARDPMERALRLHEQAVSADSNIRRNKSYYDLLNSVYSQLNISNLRTSLLEKMINFWPAEASYWEQLSGLYSQADRSSDAAAVLELAYKNGLISDENRIVSLVQYYSLLENPYRGGKLLEREMAAGNVKRTQKNLELLAQMWNLAREQKKSAAALEEAAAMAPNGELYYRLGQAYFADEQYRKAEDRLTQALNRGGISGRARGNIWLLIGNARYNLDTNDPNQRARAITAWRNVGTTTGASQTDKDSAIGWIRYVTAVERQECDQDKVERLVKVDNYSKDKASCESNLAIYDRAGEGGGFLLGLSENRIAECRRIVASEIDEKTAIITYDDGETEGTQRPGFCSKYE